MIVTDSPDRIPVEISTADNRVRIRQGTAEVSLTADEFDSILDSLDNRPRLGRLWSNRGR